MQQLRKMPLMTFILCCLVCTNAAAADAEWKLLGIRTVPDKVDHDVISVTGAKGTFRKIKITVQHSAVDFHRVVVHFANGADQEVEMRHTIEAGGETRAIDLNGADRIIKSVEFWYDAKGHGRGAVVTLYGRD